MPCAETSEPAGAEIWQKVNSAWRRKRRECLSGFGGNPAKRCLFGSFSPDEVRDFVQKELKLIREHDMKRYNFDFERMTPLPGRFQWQCVEPSTAAVLACSVPPPLASPPDSCSDQECSRLSAAHCSTPFSRARRRIRLESGTPQRCPCRCALEQAASSRMSCGVAAGPGDVRHCGACGSFLYEVCDAQTSPGLSSPDSGSDRLSCSPHSFGVGSVSRARRQHNAPDPNTFATSTRFAQQMKITDFFRSRKLSSPGHSGSIKLSVCEEMSSPSMSVGDECLETDALAAPAAASSVSLRSPTALL